jgi:hypothetical protein
MPTITGKAIGRKKPLFDDFSVSLPPEADGGDDRTTLRDVISHVVRTEVASFTGRQRERRLLKVLTESQIADAVATGKVDMGGRDLEQGVDTDEAVGVALQAFEDGMYLVVLDEEEKKSLEEQVYLQPDSRITFVRLTMLSGG